MKKAALRLVAGAAAFAAVLGGAAVWLRAPNAEEIAAIYAQAATPLEKPARVFHLGHSLVGPDMPAMLAQLSGAGQDYAVQLGWGTSLKEHWEPDLLVNGFAMQPDSAQFRDARAALASGRFDAFVLTEMVEIRDAIRHHDSAHYLRLWEAAARAGNPDIRVFLYETWPRLDDPEGWLARLDADPARYWEDEILLKDLPADFAAHPTYVIPAGRVLAHFVRRVEQAGGIGQVATREDLFARDSSGAVDPIHINDLGAYLVALTHYAVLYQSSPVGLPHELRRADGSLATAPSPDLARAMQESVWAVVRTEPKTGVGS